MHDLVEHECVRLIKQISGYPYKIGTVATVVTVYGASGYCFEFYESGEGSNLHELFDLVDMSCEEALIYFEKCN